MNFLPSWKYQLDGMKWPLIIFYTVIAALLILMGVSMSIAIREGNQFTVGGLEMASVVFIFICGLNSFKAAFHMLSANGVSRKTMFVSFLAVLGTVAAGMAVIDSTISLLMRSVGEYHPGFMQMYGIESYSTSAVLTGVLWMFCTNMAAGMAGYLLTTLYYRMNKPVKLLVSIGVPVLLLFVWPIADWALFRGAVSIALTRFTGWAFGFMDGNPFRGIVTNVLLVLIFVALSFAALRRAPVKARQQ